MKTIFTLLLIIFLFSTTVGAQEYFEPTDGQTKLNFYDIQNKFKQKWANKPYEKGEGYKQYKRWEYYWQDRINKDGSFPNVNTFEIWEKYKQDNPQLFNSSIGNIRAGSWQPLGPNSSTSGYAGIGRINCLGFHPTNVNIIYAGSAAGGVWRTVNGGTNWTPISDNIPSLGISSIVVHPTTPNTIYIATGDKDSRDTYSVGVLKSIDGGTTWNATGLSFTQSQNYIITKLLIHPTNNNTLIASTNGGIFRTTNGGTSWTQVTTGNFNDMEQKPGDPNTLYASTSSAVYRSTNGGANWSFTASLSTSIRRTEIAVSAANTSLVEILAANSTGGLYGIYRSTNSGANFSRYFTGTSTNNILASDPAATGTSGQGYYDLAFCISPTNANTKFVGGVNTWRTTNNGTSFSINNVWSGHYGLTVQTVHADKHYIIYHPLSNSTIFECNDGGIYKSTNDGVSWTDISNGLEITQLYKIGTSPNSTDVVCGTQDNGTKLYTISGFSDILGGDGMECMINNTNSNIQYGTLYFGEIRKTTDRWMSWSDITPRDNFGSRIRGEWVTPFTHDPNNQNIIYGGFNNLYRSNNQGINWSVISTPNSNGNLTEVVVAKSNSLIIYISDGANLWRTVNGGTSWNVLGAAQGNTHITHIAVNPTNADDVWLTLSAYDAGEKVYRTTNGGTSWSNHSYNLPNLPVNCIVTHNNGTEVFIGTDVGCFHKTAGATTWTPFSDGLPNVVVNELEIVGNEIYAATYGRGLWKSSTSLTSVQPTASFAVSHTTVCTGDTIRFTNNSTNATSYKWYLYNGNTLVDSSTSTNLNLFINTAGTYNFDLVAYNGSNSDRFSLSTPVNVIACTKMNTNATVNSCNGVLVDDGGLTSNYANGINYFVTIQDNSNANFIQINSVSFDLESDPNCTYDYLRIFDANSANVSHLIGKYCGTNFPTTTIQSSGNALTFEFLSDATVNESGFRIDWTCVPNGSSSIDERDIEIIQLKLYPNPTSGVLNFELSSKNRGELTIEIYNSIGQKILSKNYSKTSEVLENKLDISNYPSGTYLLKIGNNTYRFVKE